jgi:hypothetical protein
MTDKAKLEKIKKLADAMYYAAQYLTTDASRLHKAMEEYHQFIINEWREEPVSEDLEEAAEKYAYELCPSIGVANTEAEQSFKAGAKWQKEQFVKNRLAACNKQTEEEAEIERDFVMGIIEKEHRQPAFDDAIKYGMERMKQQIMAKAIDGDITFDYYSDDDKTYGCIAHDSFCLEDFGLKDRDKVKVIIIKENRV